MTEQVHPELAGGTRRFTARDAILAIVVAAVLLVVCDGDGMRSKVQDMRHDTTRAVLLPIAKPAGAIADALPFSDIAHKLTGWLSPDQDLGTKGGRFSAGPVAGGGVSAVSPGAFSPQSLGAKAAPARPLRTVMVTGDSMSQPLDADLARELVGKGVKTFRDPHLGTGISDTTTVDWGRLAVSQIDKHPTDAVVMFIGANEGFPMTPARGKAVNCCGAPWAAEYATRARAIMSTYLRGGAGHVVWLSLPTPRDPARAKISKVVNSAVKLAAAPFGAQVQILPIDQEFTPGERYRDAMQVGGRKQIVRESDGVHLNDVGSKLAADTTVAALRGTFSLPSS